MQSLKSEIRRSILERLKKQGRKARTQKSRVIEKKLFQRREFQNAKVVMFYLSLPEEVETRRMIRRALLLGKRVAVPKCEKGRLKPFEIRNLKEVAPGRYGIFEPRNARPIRIDLIDLIVVPGVAFDAKGNRLGRGKGYYDRFLKRVSGRIPVVGLAFKLQKLSALPTSSRDIPVTDLISA